MSQSKKLLYSFLAGLTFIVHFLLVFVVAFGWLVPALFYPFVILLVLTVVSELIFGACVLSIWEFGLRRKIDPRKEYDSSCIMHYGRAMFGLKPRVKNNLPKTFFKKYSFLIMLFFLLCIGVSYHFIII